MAVPKKTILLVDDHAAVRSGLGMLLQNGGFAVIEAADAEQTWAQLQSQGVDLVLVDTQLESENGIELASALRQKHPKLPVAMLSMHSELSQVRSAVRAGANGYLLKQAEGEEVVAAARLLVFGGFYLDPRLAPAFLKSPPDARNTRQDSAAERKRIVLEALGENCSNGEIAQRLGLSVSSVKAYLRDLYEEHQVKDRPGLLLALRHSVPRNQR